VAEDITGLGMGGHRDWLMPGMWTKLGYIILYILCNLSCTNMSPMDGVQSALLKAAINKWISPLAGDKIDAVEKDLGR
jgi:hypothetical protein